MPSPPLVDAPRRPSRRTAALGAVAATIVVLVAIVAGGCDPRDPRLSPPNATQRSSTTLAPSIDSVPPGNSTPSSGSTPGDSAPSSSVAVPDGPTTVAHARSGLTSIDVFAGPGLPAPTASVPNPGEYGNVQVFVVVEQREDGWLHVLLPVRPNGSSGWIRRGDVDLVVHNYRIDVSLSGFRLKVRKDDQVILEAPIGVGTSDTPTPAAIYYTWVLLAPTNSGYGQYAYGLSGFSEVLNEFAGGNARLGIHGTADESTIGTNVSHGCIRVSDTTVIKMVEELGLPLGIPVSVTA